MINFEKWNRYTTKYFIMDRIYFDGYMWTPFIKIKLRKRKSTLEQMREMVNVQSLDGNWNYDSYMHGMYNGMELMLAIEENREPNYKNCPDKWLRDKATECMDNITPIETVSDGGIH